jgi:hypothetical protein
MAARRIVAGQFDARSDAGRAGGIARHAPALSPTYQAAATRCLDCDAVEVTPLPGPGSRRGHQRAP